MRHRRTGCFDGDLDQRDGSAAGCTASRQRYTDRMKASLEDRTSHCERPDLPAGAPRICEIAQAITVQEQQADVV